MILILLVIASTVSATYSSANVTVWGGGFGFGTKNGTAMSQGHTQLDYLYPIRVTGTLVRFRARMIHWTAYPTAFKIKVFRGTPGAFTLVGSYDINDHVTAAAVAADGNNKRFNYDTDSTYGSTTCALRANGIAVQVGDYLGYYQSYADSVSIIRSDSENGLIYDIAGDNTPASTTVTYLPLVDCQVTTNAFIIDDDSTGWTNTSANWPVSCYSDQPQYITLSNVSVPDTCDLRVNFLYRNSTGTTATAFSLDVNFINDVNQIQALGYTFDISKQEANHFDIDVWLDPVKNLAKVHFVNYENGQGGKGDSDTQHISLTNRVAYAAGSVFPIRDINFAGTGGSISKIKIYRKPIVVLGDSFTSTLTDGNTIPYRIGAKLDDLGVFSQQRVCINGGQSGRQLDSNSSSAHTSGMLCWDDVANHRDLIDYNDAVVCIVNGACLNDIGVATAATLSADINTIVTGALAAGNDVILTDLIPYPAGTEAQRNEVTALDILIRGIAKAQRVPMAITNPSYNLSWYSDSGTHPDSTYGVPYIAGKIVTAYENNLIPATTTIMSSQYSRRRN